MIESIFFALKEKACYFYNQSANFKSGLALAEFLPT